MIPTNRLAVVLIDRRSGSVTQRLAPARQISSPEFQDWLRERNRMGADVFVSMNALEEQARGRTRADVAFIRHIYLDFDDNGTEAIGHLQSRDDIPKPNYLVNTSPDHWQLCRYRHNCHNADSGIMPRARLMTRSGGISPSSQSA